MKTTYYQPSSADEEESTLRWGRESMCIGGGRALASDDVSCHLPTPRTAPMKLVPMYMSSSNIKSNIQSQQQATATLLRQLRELEARCWNDVKHLQKEFGINNDDDSDDDGNNTSTNRRPPLLFLTQARHQALLRAIRRTERKRVVGVRTLPAPLMREIITHTQSDVALVWQLRPAATPNKQARMSYPTVEQGEVLRAACLRDIRRVHIHHPDHQAEMERSKKRVHVFGQELRVVATRRFEPMRLLKREIPRKALYLEIQRHNLRRHLSAEQGADHAKARVTQKDIRRKALLCEIQRIVYHNPTEQSRRAEVRAALKRYEQELLTKVLDHLLWVEARMTRQLKRADEFKQELYGLALQRTMRRFDRQPRALGHLTEIHEELMKTQGHYKSMPRGLLSQVLYHVLLRDIRCRKLSKFKQQVGSAKFRRELVRCALQHVVRRFECMPKGVGHLAAVHKEMMSKKTTGNIDVLQKVLSQVCRRALLREIRRYDAQIVHQKANQALLCEFQQNLAQRIHQEAAKQIIKTFQRLVLRELVPHVSDAHNKPKRPLSEIRRAALNREICKMDIRPHQQECIQRTKKMLDTFWIEFLVRSSDRMILESELDEKESLVTIIRDGLEFAAKKRAEEMSKLQSKTKIVAQFKEELMERVEEDYVVMDQVHDFVCVDSSIGAIPFQDEKSAKGGDWVVDF